MVNYTILAGGFTSFIISYLFDSDAGTLSLIQNSTTGDSPSWIVSNPQNTSILYAVNEIAPVGNLQSFTVNPDGGLTLVDTVPTGGNGPTFSSVLSTGEVSAMNFGSPNCSFIPTLPNDPLHFARDTPVVSFPVPDGFPSNPHMSLEYNGEIFVPDLGGDKIWRIVSDGAPGHFRVQGQIDVDKGTGPRHIAIQNGILFTVHETVSTLTAQFIPPAPNGTALPLLANVSTFPADAPAGAKFAAAEILIPPATATFPEQLIYVSNRNIATGDAVDPRGDTIAIFEFDNGAANRRHVGRAQRRAEGRGAEGRGARFGLGLVAQVFTGLDQIRGMMVGRVVDGGDAFIAASGFVGTGGVVVFQRVDGGRNLTEVARNTEEATRTSFVFV